MFVFRSRDSLNSDCVVQVGADTPPAREGKGSTCHHGGQQQRKERTCLPYSTHAQSIPGKCGTVARSSRTTFCSGFSSLVISHSAPSKDGGLFHRAFPMSMSERVLWHLTWSIRDVTSFHGRRFHVGRNDTCCTAPVTEGGAMAGPTHPSSDRISTGRQELFQIAGTCALYRSAHLTNHSRFR